MTVIRRRGHDYRARAPEWMTDMARLAATEFEADWVVHTDADEFWWPVAGSLTETLAGVHDRYGVLMGPAVRVHRQARRPGTFAERLTIREARSPLHSPRWPTAPNPDVVSSTGDPTTSPWLVPPDVTETIRPPGRPVHRTIRNREHWGRAIRGGHPAGVGADVAGADPPLPGPVVGAVQAPDPGGDLRGACPDRGRFQRLREHYEEGRLDELYDELALDDGDVAEGIREGRLVRDERFAHLLQLCPDPLDGGLAEQLARAGVAPDPPPPTREVAVVEHRDDAPVLPGVRDVAALPQPEALHDATSVGSPATQALTSSGRYRRRRPRRRPGGPTPCPRHEYSVWTGTPR